MITRDIKDRYINPYTDFGFKKLFGTEMNKGLLACFINSLLHGREQIKELTYLNTEHLGTGESDRRAVFDVYCENEHGEKFLVEMQRGEQQFFKDRVFTKLFDAAEIAKFDKVEYEAYEESLKALRDWKNVLETAEKKAREEGRTEGRMEGILEMVRQMKSAGVPIDVIAQCNGLSEEEINQLEE